MIKRITLQFEVEITDEMIEFGIISDEAVIEQLKEEYNMYIRGDECSDVTVKIETIKERWQ